MRLEALAALFGHDEFLEGLDLPRSPAFSGWLVAERRRLRAAHAAVLEHWVQALPADSDAALAALERWLALAPFDRRAHEGLLERLAERNRLREGDEHLASAARQHEAEGQDWTHLAIAWRAAKARHAGVKISGCTVHFVDAGLDSGPIVLQRTVPVEDGDDEDALARRILAEEHRAYPRALARLLEERWVLEGRRLRFLPDRS